MKKTLSFFICVSILFASCKKNDAPDPTDEKLYEVKFKVGLFSQTISDFPDQVSTSAGKGKVMSTNSESPKKLSDYISSLEYYLFNSQGTRIANRRIEKDTTKASGFELPTANLKAGKYRVGFVGSETLGRYPSGHTFFYYDNLFDPYLHYGLGSNIKDVLHSAAEFEVGNEDSYVGISLRRAGGRLKIVVEDEWPSNVERIILTINGGANYFLARDHLDQWNRSDLYVNKNYTYEWEMVNGYPVQKQKFVDCSWEDFILTNNSTPTTLSGVLTAFSKYNDIIVTKSLSNIRVEKGKITTARGKLFDDLGFNPTSNFNITVEEDLQFGEINTTF